MAEALVSEEINSENSVTFEANEKSNLTSDGFPGVNASVSGIGKETLKKLGLEFLSEDEDDDLLSDGDSSGCEDNEKDLETAMSGMSLEKKRFRRKISESSIGTFRNEIKEIFDILDVDGMGKIRTREVSFAMQALGYDPGREEIKEIKATLDPNSTGMVAYEDFSKLLIEKMTVKNPKLPGGDNKGDKQKMPSNFEDFKNFAKGWGEYWTDDEIRVMVEETDENNSEISLEDFKKYMTERTARK